jgi:death-on-curing protein
MTMFVTADDVEMINARFIGPDKLRDFGALDSAVMRPQATAFGEDAYPTIHEKAGAMLHSLARNHPFLDGNKRTAWAATSVFLPNQRPHAHRR